MSSYSSNFIYVLRLLLHPDPTRRPSARDCMSQLLRDNYVGANARIIFRNKESPTSGITDQESSSEDKDHTIRRLLAENEELKQKLAATVVPDRMETFKDCSLKLATTYG